MKVLKIMSSAKIMNTLIEPWETIVLKPMNNETIPSVERNVEEVNENEEVEKEPLAVNDYSSKV